MYKKIGKKSPIKSFRKRKLLKRYNRKYKSTLFKGRAELSVLNPTQHFARIQETVLLSDINVNTTYYETFQLNQFIRAMQIAPNFKWYRPKKVIFKYEPLFETYIDGPAGADSLPYMYVLMNRTQERTAYTGTGLRAQGCVPKVFKNAVTITYKPNWCTQGLGAYTQAPGGPITSINATGLQKCYDWLQTPKFASNGNLDATTPIMSNQLLAVNVNPMALYTSNTIFNGHLVYFDQALVGGNPVVCRRTVSVIWEFKGPKVDTNLVNTQVSGVQPDIVVEDISHNLNL